MIRVSHISRREFTRAFAAALLCPGLGLGQQRRAYRFGVFTLFEPQQIVVSPAEQVLLHADNGQQIITPFMPFTVQRENRCMKVTLHDSALTTRKLTITALSGDPCTLALTVPPGAEHNGISRRFRGTFEVLNGDSMLTPVVVLNEDGAVASIVAAESAPHAPASFLESQAIVSRSFLIAARTSHVGFDFCDTTHCQFLQEAPDEKNPAALATTKTRSLRLSFAGKPLAAMYSRSCGGRTHTLAELGIHSMGYPYYAVECAFCRQHPERWQRELDGAKPKGERERLAFNRVHGWSALPSNTYLAVPHGIEGRGIGHGLGLCQLGAFSMAQAGASAESILAHYYPNAVLD